MKILKKLTYKNLALNKKRTIVTIIGIILSVALITAVSSVYMSGISSLILFAKNEKGDYHLSLEELKKEDINNLKVNRAIDNIYLTSEIGYAKVDSKNTDKPYARIVAFDSNALENMGLTLTEGRMPTKDDEILITTHLKNNGRVNYSVGDKITLDIGKRVSIDDYPLNIDNSYQSTEEKIIDTVSKTYTIVGRIERPSTTIEPYYAAGYTMLTYLDNLENKNVTGYIKLNQKGRKDPYKYIANILNIDETKLKRFYNALDMSEDEISTITSELNNSKYKLNSINDYLIGLETDPIKSSGIGGLGAVVIIVLIIIVVTSVFCIKNSFDISITEKNKQYGMLRSVGATKKQIRQNVLYEGFILGLIGIPLGILCGLLATYLLIIISNFLLSDMLTAGLKLVFKISYIALALAVILGIITIYLSSLKSMLKASKNPPISSIRNSANIKLKSKKMHTPKIIKKIFGIGGVISYKNLKRNKKAYRTTTVSLVLSVAVFIALFSFMTMGSDALKKEITLNDYNMSLTISNKETNALKEIASIKEITDYSIVTKKTALIKNANYNKEYTSFLNWDEETKKNNRDAYLTVVSIGDIPFQKYLNSLGITSNPSESVILMDYSWVSNSESDKYLETFNYKDNDKITLQINSNEEKEYTITKVTNKPPFGLKSYYCDILIVSDKFLSTIESSNTDPATMYMLVDNDSLVTEQVENILGDISYDLYNQNENYKVVKNFYILISIFLYGFIIVISLIGVTNIFNTITTNMELRRQEFAMLKSIGMTKKEFKRMIYLETLFMGIKSLILGVSLGLMLSYLIYNYLGKQNGFPYTLPTISIIISILVVFLLLFILMRYSMNKINKQNIIETIRNENI